MIQTFTISGRLPGINDYTAAQRRNKYGGAKMKKAAQKHVEAEIWAARLRTVDSRARLVYTFYEPNRRRDMDNISGFAHKVIQDALVNCRILSGDGWKNITGMTDVFKIDSDNPRIEVTLVSEG